MGIFFGKKTEDSKDWNSAGDGAETGTGEIHPGPSSTFSSGSCTAPDFPDTLKSPSPLKTRQNQVLASSSSDSKLSSSKGGEKTENALKSKSKSKSKTKTGTVTKIATEMSRGSKRKAKISPLSRVGKRLILTPNPRPQPELKTESKPETKAKIEPELESKPKSSSSSSHDVNVEVDADFHADHPQVQCSSSSPSNCEDLDGNLPNPNPDPKPVSEIEPEPELLSQEMKEQIYSSPSLSSRSNPIPVSPCLFVPPIKIKIKIRLPKKRLSISKSVSSSGSGAASTGTSRSHSDSSLDMNLTCKVCGKVRTTKESFQEHKKFHNQPGFEKEDYSFHCRFALCLRSFRTEENLNLHLISHSNTTVTEFQCDQCQRHFIADWALEFHQTICPSAARQRPTRDCYSSKDNFVYY